MNRKTLMFSLFAIRPETIRAAYGTNGEFFLNVTAF
jgi:hypothetical protein